MAFLALMVGLLWLTDSTAWADANTDRFQYGAREMLQKPYLKAPYPCSLVWAGSRKDHYVVDMPPWAAAAGLRRGDRIVAYGGTRVTGVADSDREAWAHLPRGEYVEIRVQRAGNEMSLRLPCRDDRETWAASMLTLRAIEEGRWQACIDAVSHMAKVSGYSPSEGLWIGATCMLEKSKLDKQRVPDAYWARLHAWATKAIAEAGYRPIGLAEIRARLLTLTEQLDKAGRNSLADDIKQQIGTFALKIPSTNEPPSSASAGTSEGKSVQRVGTAFAVGPDGSLLTAFHVVKGAKVIDVSCPNIAVERASIGQFSEANDLAVLRLSQSKTPTYLGMADQRSVTLGQQVFTIGYPAPDLLGSEAKFTEGVVSSLSVGGDAGYMQISVPVQPGNSGGPLLNSSGDVVGIVVATASALSFLKGTGALPQNVSWAVKGAFAAPLFDAAPILPRLSDRTAVVQRAQRATCFVRASADTGQ